MALASGLPAKGKRTLSSASPLIRQGIHPGNSPWTAAVAWAGAFLGGWANSGRAFGRMSLVDCVYS